LLPHLAWETGFLANNPVLRTKRFGIPAEAKSVAYPVRLLRYWFGFHLIREEAERTTEALRVAEVGVHTGQMYEFYQSVTTAPKPGRWTAYDAVLLPDKLKKAGYTEWREANLESDSFALDGDYDTVVLLHILEHLFEPEAAVRRIAGFLPRGASIIGGFPVLPDFLVKPREAAIRKTAAPMGHVSVFSPARVRRMARQAGCEVDFLAGAYFLRSKGSPLENSALWLKFNLLWAGLLPGWPGEVYWRMRKIS